MDKQLRNEINSTLQIKKFSAYGFLKNLKFFEPYLVIFLLGSGYSLFQIGLLYSICELITYLFEVPSGIIADYYGRKKELYLCFTFYIVSFSLFFVASSFWMVIVAMAFFGLGEAFRSGTHKAMIYTYLEERGWAGHKAYVYGRTRSFSLIGSAVSSILAILLILNIPSSKYIFLASILPYILDLFLIMSYPNSLDVAVKKNKVTVKDIKNHLEEIYKRPLLRRIILNSSLFESIFKSVKDLIQPILETVILSSGVLLIHQMTVDENLKVILGLSYGFIYILSAIASKRAYLLKQYASSGYLLNAVYMMLAFCMAALYFIIKGHQTFLIIVMFLGLYILKDIRKPIFVDACDDYMEKHHRATVLSIESQIKALFTVILAPVVGFLADTIGISYAMLGLSGLMLILFMFVRIVKANDVI